MTASAGNLMCFANFPANTGYAWDFIEETFAALADDLTSVGVRTWVAYPSIERPPAALRGSAAEPVELALDLRSVKAVTALGRELARRQVHALYLIDQPIWHPAYALLRRYGVRTIVVHDHTSGERTVPTGVRRLLKRWARAFRPALADRVIAVSEYVRSRKLLVDLVPAERLDVVLNSLAAPPSIDRGELRRTFDVPPDRKVVVCACRADERKGVQVLFRAFDLLVAEAERPPVLVYFGDGPYLPELRRLRAALPSGPSIHIAGYRPDVADLIGGADLCVVPSLWAEAFALAALEPAMRGVPVVASSVGGLPEVVVDGETGFLVPPGHPEPLAAAMARILARADLGPEMGRRGRARAERLFSRDEQRRKLSRLVRAAMGLAPAVDPSMSVRGAPIVSAAAPSVPRAAPSPAVSSVLEHGEGATQ